MRKKKLKDTIKYDCFAYKKDLENSKNPGKCIALKGLYCKCGECPFYKTEEKFNSESKKKVDSIKCCKKPTVSWRTKKKDKRKFNGEARYDCFAYRSIFYKEPYQEKCQVLTELLCKKQDCPFYKKTESVGGFKNDI